MSGQLVIVIPVYRSTLLPDEQRSVRRLLSLCPQRDIRLVGPQSLTAVQGLESLPIEHFPDSFFTNITAYNQLMMSPLFYQRFEAFDYVLIHQTDAFLFRDELDQWCHRQYSYVGAPWVKKHKYHGWKQFLLLLRAIPKRLSGIPFLPLDLANKVGNGGLSLRYIPDFLRVCREQPKEMQYWIAKSKRHAVYNEDCFWATRPCFRYPDYHEALQFSFDMAPRDSWEQNNHQIPMGCHGWSKPMFRSFWLPIIDSYFPA